MDRYLSLYEESININSRELEDRLRNISIYGRRCLLQLLRKPKTNNVGNSAEVIPSILHDKNEIFEC